MILRDAGPPDVAQIARVLHDWCQATPWLPKLHTPAQDLWFAGSLMKTHVLRVGFAKGLGFLARMGPRIDALYLAPEARGRGLGRALLDEAKTAGHLGLYTFQANLDARRFYAREGFHEVRFTNGAENDEKLPDVWMEWDA